MVRHDTQSSQDYIRYEMGYNKEKHKINKKSTQKYILIESPNMDYVVKTLIL